MLPNLFKSIAKCLYFFCLIFSTLFLVSCTSLESEIIGKWQAVNGNGETIEFYKDGTITTTSSVEINIVGDYRFIDKNTIRIDSSGLMGLVGPQVFDVKISNDTLILTSGFTSIKYNRFDSQITKIFTPVNTDVFSNRGSASTPTIELTTSTTELPSHQDTFEIGSTITREKDGMVMVYVPAGPFRMGGDGKDYFDEKPIHTLSLDAFWIDKTEVTNAMFQKFVHTIGYKTDAEKAGVSLIVPYYKEFKYTPGANWQHPQGIGSDLTNLSEHPVVHISWNDAKTYCEWVGARLPSEAEWEKTARGIDGRTYPWGEMVPNGELLNFADKNLDVDWADKNSNDGYKFTSPVGSYPAGASPYGALDMLGNVLQWTSDWYQAYPGSDYNGGTDYTGSSIFGTKYRVRRGLSWFSQINYSSRRDFGVPEESSNAGGFRCIRSP
jgi:formylglycine-generating enzyme required for sulfatase activity